MSTSHKRSAESMAAAADRIGAEFERAKENIGRAAGATGEDLAAQLRQLSDDIAAIKETIAGFGKTTVTEAAGAAQGMGAAASAAAGEFAAGAKHDAGAVVDEVETFARQNPLTVLAGAVGFGLVLGLLLRRH